MMFGKFVINYSTLNKNGTIKYFFSSSKMGLNHRSQYIDDFISNCIYIYLCIYTYFKTHLQMLLNSAFRTMHL